MIEVNGRAYAKPKRSTVVVCLDGCDPRYLNFKNAEKVFTNISRMMRNGFSTLADAAMPTFTNPNNVSIVTGARPRFMAFLETTISIGQPAKKL